MQFVNKFRHYILRPFLSLPDGAQIWFGNWAMALHHSLQLLLDAYETNSPLVVSAHSDLIGSVHPPLTSFGLSRSSTCCNNFAIPVIALVSLTPSSLILHQLLQAVNSTSALPDEIRHLLFVPKLPFECVMSQRAIINNVD